MQIVQGYKRGQTRPRSRVKKAEERWEWIGEKGELINQEVVSVIECQQAKKRPVQTDIENFILCVTAIFKVRKPVRPLSLFVVTTCECSINRFI
jgi:hypothetical protein